MRIALIARSNLFTNPGGDTLYILNIKKYLEKYNVKADIIAKRKDFTLDYDVYNFFNLGDYKTLLPYLFELKNKKMPVILHTLWLRNKEIEKMIIEIYKRYSRFKKIFNFGAKLVGEVNFKNLLIFLNKFRRKRKESLILNLVSLIIVSSYTEKKFLLEYYSDLENLENKIYLLPTPILEEIQLINYKEKDFGGNKILFKDIIGKSFLLNVGRIDPFKNQILILKALQNIEDIPIVFVLLDRNILSNPPQNFKSYYMEFKELLEKRKNTYLYSNLTLEDLAFLYKNCKIYCHPSIFESYGLSILEAYYFGAELIITKYCGVKDFLDVSNIEFINNPLDELELREKIIKKFNSQVKRDINNPLNLLNWEEFTKKLLSIFEKFL